MGTLLGFLIEILCLKFFMNISGVTSKANLQGDPKSVHPNNSMHHPLFCRICANFKGCAMRRSESKHQKSDEINKKIKLPENNDYSTTELELDIDIDIDIQSNNNDYITEEINFDIDIPAG
ncbi:hypothetical protein RhiirA1_395534 [Rhizophagus irregularis]|uniref:Uncharacterized protein n=1 Tax=Rhizophagus irregularis TaxID=588596 RepID=A0A2N0RP87_9GLOM|nr:hypothetical protein RhiirA1_395534 [Rhizophagus irregularis]